MNGKKGHVIKIPPVYFQDSKICLIFPKVHSSSWQGRQRNSFGYASFFAVSGIAELL